MFFVYNCIIKPNENNQQYVMPKVKQLHKIIAYDKDNKIFGTFDVRTWSFEDAFKEYMEMCQLLGQGKFFHVHRLDFVGGNHVLFMFCDVRSIVNQNNLFIKIKSYD